MVNSPLSEKSQIYYCGPLFPQTQSREENLPAPAPMELQEGRSRCEDPHGRKAVSFCVSHLPWGRHTGAGMGLG